MSLRVILSAITFSFMPVTTRYQVNQGKRPQVVFNQLPLVQTRQRHKEKGPIFDQSPRNTSEIWFDSKSHLSELGVPLASSHSSMDMSYTMTWREKEARDKRYDDMFAK